MSKFCSNCGNELVEEAVICPKCGVAVSKNIMPSNNTSETSNGMATAGFILSFFIPLLGLIFSIMGLKKSKETSTGKGLSTAGIIISSITMFITLILLVVAVIAFNTIDEVDYSDGYYNYYQNYNRYE